MKRYQVWVITSIALAIAGCQTTPKAEESSPAAGVSQGLEASEAALPGTLPAVPAGTDAAKPRISTNFSSATTSKPTSSQPPSAITANFQQNSGPGRGNPFNAVNQPQVEVSYVNPPGSKQLPQVPQVTSPNVATPGTSQVAAMNPTGPRVAIAAPATTTLPQTSPQLATVNNLPANGAKINPAPVNPAFINPVAVAPLPVPSVPALPLSTPPQLGSAAGMPVSPTAIAEAIEIKGVVQVGEQFNIIIRDPDSPTSRTVKVGDVIGGGKVKISRIDAADSREPQVVLEQNGVEIVRAIGV